MLSPPSTSDQPLIPGYAVSAAFLLLLTLTVPLFVCAPVTSDVSLFDVQAMTVLKDGVLYRDVLEPNLPGIVWIHVLFRSVAGWSSEAVRGFDLAVFFATLFVFCRIIRQGGKIRHWNLSLQKAAGLAQATLPVPFRRIVRNL